MNSALLRILVAGITSIVMFAGAVAIVFQERPQHEMATGLLLACFMCCTFVLMLRSLEPIQALPTMFCMFYFGYFYILPGAVQISSNTFQMADVTYNDAVATRAALIIVFFLLAFFAGQSMVGRHRYTEALRRIEESEKYSRVLPIAIFCVMAVLLGLICIKVFGTGVLMSTRGDFKENMLQNLSMSGSQVGLLLNLPRAMALVGVLLLIYAIGRWRREKPAMNALVAWPLLVMLVPVFSVVNFPLALARNWQFGIMIAFLIVFVKGWKPWLRVGMVAGMFLTMFTLFPLLSGLRHAGEPISYEDDVSDPIDYLKKMDFDGYQTTMNTVIYADFHDYSYGKQLTAALLFWIPRSVWPNKGESTGQTVGQGLGFHFTNLSTPMPAEFYIDFSFAGVILSGLFFGYLYRRMDYICAAAIDFGRNNIHLIVIAIATSYTIFIMRGALYAVINIFAPLAVLAFLLLKAPAIMRFFFTSGASRSAGPPLLPR